MLELEPYNRETASAHWRAYRARLIRIRERRGSLLVRTTSFAHRKNKFSSRGAGGRISIPHLLDCWSEVAPRIRAAHRIRLYLDFDGTLVSYRPHPEQVRLRKKTQLVLQHLASNERVHLAIVSGRRRAQLIRHFNVPGIQFLGLYGWETGDKIALPRAAASKLSIMRKALAGLPDELAGISIEDKGASVVVHFRDALPEVQRRAQARVCKLIAPYKKDLHVLRSISAWDIVPRQVGGKGDALRRELKSIHEPFLPIYVGDDTTDEPAFAALRRGITALVGSARRTGAHFSLRDTDEVCLFLNRLEEELS